MCVFVLDASLLSLEEILKEKMNMR